ncbi:hypothetical protein [Neptuniibacter sp. QD37_11]|uniref:hypothetical protein n=1 Tax=Neptuniibacter sp. QD37_11 TaxID=3398209 RepID=UPI0039F478A3
MTESFDQTRDKRRTSFGFKHDLFMSAKDRIDDLVVQVDYDGAPLDAEHAINATGWLVETILEGEYPHGADNLPIPDGVRCKDQHGATVFCSTDMDGETLLVFKRHQK